MAWRAPGFGGIIQLLEQFLFCEPFGLFNLFFLSVKIESKKLFHLTFVTAMCFIHFD
jgi:hypothetical protein